VTPNQAARILHVLQVKLGLRTSVRLEQHFGTMIPGEQYRRMRIILEDGWGFALERLEPPGEMRHWLLTCNGAFSSHRLKLKQTIDDIRAIEARRLLERS
jgi:hypothetical protein